MQTSLFTTSKEITQADELPRRQKLGPLGRSEERFAWMMLTPVLLALLLVGVYPAITSIIYAFEKGGYYGINMSFGGFTNFVRLKNDPQFWSSLKFSLLYTVITVSGQMILGTALALLANLNFPGRWVLRAAILFPWVIPTATNSVIWQYMFNDQYGMVNSVLIHLHLMSATHPVVWLGTAQSATWLIFILAIWKANSLVALLVLAGLQGIPTEIYEAARVDGATHIQTFARITLPLLMPTLLVTMTLRTIESLQAFDLIIAFTNGGPVISTQNLGLYIYTQISQYGNYGYGSAIVTVLMVITLVFVVAYLSMLFRSNASESRG